MPVLSRVGLLNEIVDFPRDRWRRSRWSPKVWREQLGRFAKLRSIKFDFGMDLQGHSKTAACLRIANPKKRIAAFATDRLAHSLNRMAPGDPNGRHRVERMLETAREFGDFQMPARPIMPAVKSREDLLLPSGKLASISTGAGAMNKQYPAAQWRVVGKGLQSQGFQVVLLGADQDPRVDLSGSIDKVGKWDLASTMSAVAASDVHLAADTGTGHMAAAYGVPFVSIFGPTDPKLFRPFSNQGTVLRKSDSPADVETSEVLKAVEDLIG
jgi:ADP-heptose:LPS heptosyltransferase